MVATLYNKTIYLSEVETEHARSKAANESPRMKEMSYWGVKFEDYVTSAGLWYSVLGKVWLILLSWNSGCRAS